jgi:hypothetical protein
MVKALSPENRIPIENRERPFLKELNSAIYSVNTR